MLRIAICDPDDSSREELRGMLLGVDFVFLDTECKRYDVFFDVIQESPPELAIVCLDTDKNKSAQLVAQLAHDFPRLPVVVIGNDNQAILQALQNGAKHFLTKPLVLEDLLRGLRKIQTEGGHSTPSSPGQPSRPSRAESHIFAVLGSRGGVGCTSLSVNLAATLAADRSNNVALIDLDLALGDADVALDLLADRTMADLALNIDKLDLNYINRTLLKHPPTNLSLLAHPMQMSDIGVIEGPHVERVLNLLRISYTHQVCDLSKGLTPVDVTALELADEVLLVAQLELSSLRNVVRMLMSLGAHDGIADKVKVIINRVGAENLDNDISMKKAADTIGREIYWQIPNDSKAMLGSRIAGEPLIRHAPRCRAQQSIEGLAQALTGRAAVTAPAKATGGLFGMFGKK